MSGRQVTARSSGTTTAESPAAQGRGGLTLVLPAVATLVVLMNYTAPLITAPQLSVALDAGPSGTTWLLSSISVGLAGALLVVGALADRYGRRRAFVVGAIGLAVTSVAGALATTVWVFVAARIAQGAASAALLVAAQSLVSAVHPAGPSRARALGLLGGMLGLGIAIGPPISAFGQETIGWQACYWLYAVLGVGLALAGRWLPESRADVRRRADLPGAVLLIGAVGALLTAFTVARQGWTDPLVTALLGGFAALLVVFALVQWRRREPLVDLHLFRTPLFVAATGGALVTGLAVVGLLSCLSTPLQEGHGIGPLVASAYFSLWAGVSALVAGQSHRLARHLTGPVQLAVGLGICAVGDLLMMGTVRDGTAGDVVRLLVALGIGGVGSGMANASLVRLAVAAVPPDRTAMGAGANNTARYIGSSLGIALVATLGASAAAFDTALLVGAVVSVVGGLAVVVVSRRPTLAASVG